MSDLTNNALPYLQAMQKVCNSLGKPYFVGEFGLSVEDMNSMGDTTYSNLTNFVKYLNQTGVQLSLLWVWNAKPTMQPSTNGSTTNVITGQGYDYQLPLFNMIVTQNLTQSLANDTTVKAVPAGKRFPPFTTVADFSANNATTNGFTIPNISSYNSTSFSVSFWIYYTGWSGKSFQRFLDMENGTNTGWTVQDSPKIAKSYMQLYNGTTTLLDTNSVFSPTQVLGRWLQVTYTFNQGDRIITYIDGIQFDKTSGSTSLYSPSTTSLKVGRWGTQSGFSNFKLSDLILYNRALSPIEVADYFNKGVCTNPAGRWNLNGDFTDSSGNANNGVLLTNGQTTPSFVSTGVLTRQPRITL
jgi:hypothetical protein